MGDLLEDVFDDNNSAFEKGAAATGCAFVCLLIWEAICAFISMLWSIGPMTFGKALLYTNMFGVGLIVISLGIGVIVASSALKKEKENDPSEQ